MIRKNERKREKTREENENGTVGLKIEKSNFMTGP